MTGSTFGLIVLSGSNLEVTVMKVLTYMLCALALAAFSSAVWAGCGGHGKNLITEISSPDDQKLIVDVREAESDDSAN